jgi:hypothetical protein
MPWKKREERFDLWRPLLSGLGDLVGVVVIEDWPALFVIALLLLSAVWWKLLFVAAILLVALACYRIVLEDDRPRSLFSYDSPASQSLRSHEDANGVP